MTKQQFKDKAIENAAQIVNYIANHEYAKLHTVTNIKTSLYGDEVTLEMIGGWLDEQLKIYSENEDEERRTIFAWMECKERIGKDKLSHTYRCNKS